MTSFVEGRLEFTFDERWRVLKWDDTQVYRDGIGKLDGTKAVDFIGLLDDASLYLIEVKDFRAAPIQNRERIKNELAIEVGQKTRDTIAGLLAALRRRPDEERWQPFVEALADPARSLRVVLWLEEVPTTSLPARRGMAQREADSRAGILLSTLKQKLAWLGTRVMVTSQAERVLPGVEARNLAGAGLSQPQAARRGARSGPQKKS